MLKQMEGGDSIAEIVPISHDRRSLLRLLLLPTLLLLLARMSSLAMLPKHLLKIKIWEV